MKCLTCCLALFSLLGINTGCSTLPRKPVPHDQMFRTEIPHMPSTSAWSGTFSEQFETDLLQSVQQAKKHEGSSELLVMPAPNILSLSGGGDYGAFGAGFINGWTQAGKRPEFNEPWNSPSECLALSQFYQ